RDGKTIPSAAAQRIRELFKSMEYIPAYFRWHDPAVRTTPAFTLWGMTRMYFWYLFRSPRHRKAFFDFNALPAYLYIGKAIFENSRLSRRRSRQYWRDVFMARNRDWKRAMPSRL